MLIDLSSLKRFFSPDKRGKLTPKELESISNSFDESLHSRLRGLSPASLSFAWLSSAIDVLAFAHSAAKSFVHDFELDFGDGLSSWYLENNMKVLDLCNCISSEIGRVCLRRLKLRIAVGHLRPVRNPSEEKICRARDLLADLEGEGGDGYVRSARNIEDLIRDLATCIGTSAPQGKVSLLERVVRRVVRAAVFLTVFVAGVISAAFHASSGAVFRVHVPEEFPWGDSFRAIESAVVAELERSEGRDRKARGLMEIQDVEASARHVLEAINEVAALGRGQEGVGRLREMVIRLEEATAVMSEGVDRLGEGVTGLFWTAMEIRTEAMDKLRAIEWERQSAETPLKLSFTIENNKVEVMPEIIFQNEQRFGFIAERIVVNGDDDEEGD